MKFVVLTMIALCAQAQLITGGGTIPRKAKPPVVFINGYQLDCGTSNFAGTFGRADEVLAADGRASVFFNNCNSAGKPAIEDLGKALGNFLASLRFDDGSPVTAIDAVAHSMGGLILRSYLSGKTATGEFAPPADVRIRKAVFLGTPHFGTGLLQLLASTSGIPIDSQLTELATGSRFIYDLATWNQGTDDLRGVDAIAVIGSGGNGVATQNRGFDDGVVALTSGSLQFYMPNRTRVISACHTAVNGPITLVCNGSAPPVAELNSAGTDNARIVLSFLNGTNEWQSIGTPAEKDAYLTTYAGLDVAVKSADDRILAIDSVTAVNGSTSRKLSSTVKEVAYTEIFPAGTVALNATAAGSTVQKTVVVAPGGTIPIALKPGPAIARVFPSAAAVFPLSVAPGGFVSVYGSELDGAQVKANDQALKIFYNSATQINALLPDGLTGLIRVTVQTASGSSAVNVLLEPAVPALFTQDFSGRGPAAALNAVTNQLVNAANPLKAGDYVSLYLTGLGATTLSNGLNTAVLQPAVTVGGKDCPVQYAGRAPGFPGLDQVNCQLPAGLAPGDAGVVVTSGRRASNLATIAVQ
jgi:uncharacterized protein (TIGR03437 family)